MNKILLMGCVGFMTFILLLFGCKKLSERDDLTLQDSHGNTLILKKNDNRWLVINYWASWCSPCLTELPELEKFYQKHKNTVQVIAVNFDGNSAKDIHPFVDPLNLTIPLVSDFPKESFGIQDITALPMTFIFSPERKLVKTLYGAQTQSALEAQLYQADAQK